MNWFGNKIVGLYPNMYSYKNKNYEEEAKAKYTKNVMPNMKSSLMRLSVINPLFIVFCAHLKLKSNI